MKAVELRGVWKYYGSYPVLRGVDLELSEGELVFIMGPSGSGKTTLLKIASGMLNPDRGEAYLLGRDLGELTLEEKRRMRRELIGFMFQEDLLIDSLTVYENVELPLAIKGVRSRRKLVEEVLDTLGLSTLMDRLPSELSGGEKRKVSLARAIVNSPKVLFLDEPTSNLDRDNVLFVVRVIKEIAERGTTILASTHDVLVGEIVDRVVKIRDGRLLV